MLPETKEITGPVVGNLVAVRENFRKSDNQPFWTVRLGGILAGDSATPSPTVDIRVDEDTYLALNEAAEDIIGGQGPAGERIPGRPVQVDGIKILVRQDYTHPKTGKPMSSYVARRTAPGEIIGDVQPLRISILPRPEKPTNRNKVVLSGI